MTDSPGGRYRESFGHRRTATVGAFQDSILLARTAAAWPGPVARETVG